MFNDFIGIIEATKTLENLENFPPNIREMLIENYGLVWEIAQPKIETLEMEFKGFRKPKPKISKRWGKIHKVKTTYETQKELLRENLQRIKAGGNADPVFQTKIVNRILKAQF